MFRYVYGLYKTPSPPPRPAALSRRGQFDHVPTPPLFGCQRAPHDNVFDFGCSSDSDVVCLLTPSRPPPDNKFDFNASSSSDEACLLAPPRPLADNKFDFNASSDSTDAPDTSPRASYLPADASRVPPPRASYASGLVRNTSRQKDTGDMNTKRREKYAQKKLYESAKKAGCDELLSEALKTEVGQSKMKLTTDGLGSSEHFKRMMANTAKLLGDMGKRHKHQVAHLLVAGLPSSFCKSSLKLTATELKRAKSHLEVEDGRGIEDACYAEDVTRCKVNDGMDTAFRNFYSRTTYQCSGADQEKTRIMDKELFEWEGMLQARWPALLREVAAATPGMVPNAEDMPKSGWTEFQACLMSAVQQVPADTAAEQKKRTDDFMGVYYLHLARLRGALPGATVKEELAKKAVQADRVRQRLDMDLFDPATYDIRAPTLRLFRKWLKTNKLRFTRFSVPHPCPLCTTGPSDEIVFKRLSARENELLTANKPVPLDLQQRCSALRKSLRIYRLHLDQLATSRKEAKEAEDNLAVGECMVIRDFVNHHDHSGNHVKCLHWVLMWRDKVGEPLKTKRLKLRHYCSDPKSLSTDSYYQADVTDFHLDEDNPHRP